MFLKKRARVYAAPVRLAMSKSRAGALDGGEATGGYLGPMKTTPPSFRSAGRSGWIPFAVALGLAAGCSRAPEGDAPASPAESDAPPEARAGLPARISREPPPPQPAGPDPAIRGLVLSAMLQDPAGDRAGMVDERSGRAGLVRAGDRFAEFTVSAVDLDRRRVVLERNGRHYTLHMRSSAPDLDSGSDGADPTPLIPDHLPGPRGLPDPVRFEPTGDERARGIDPNDPKTWPEDYRGPGIERALLEAGDGR
jgi:hypothetical protein